MRGELASSGTGDLEPGAPSGTMEARHRLSPTPLM